MSPPGGGVNRLPPTVAMLRIVQLAVRLAAVRSSWMGAFSVSAVSVTAAPIRTTSSASSIRSRPARRRPITALGSEIPSLTSGMATVPPAMTSRSGPCSSSSRSASGTDSGW